MAWKKLGLVYQPSGKGWQFSHAYVPTPFLLDKEIIRIYAAFLDENKIGRVGYVDLSAKNPREILGVSERPVLDIGAPGCFDDHGVTPMTIVPLKDRLLMYYTGWQLSSTVRYYLLTGLAESFDGGNSFQRISQVPILERSNAELIVRSAANVHYEHEGWRMWYIAGSRTIIVNGKQVPTYSIHHIRSEDGIRWPASGQVVMEPEGGDEYGFGRPWVMKSNGYLEMWYSIRSKTVGYRLGCAVSKDGINWERRDSEVCLMPNSSDSWDGDMTAFCAFVETSYGKYMFYNGNDYGRDGFGCAVWQ